MPHRVTRALAAVIGGTALLLSGCNSDADTDTPPAASSAAADFIEVHDLEGKSTKEIITELDKTDEDLMTQLVGSVRYDVVELTDGETAETVSLPIEDEFYLSMAPYVDKTHECYYHNLASCQGELVDQQLDVTITADDGEVLVDETVTTYQNGFVGFWLPRDIAGTISVSYDGKSVEAPFATGADDPTCVTTLQLS
ncbi:CueP family metal-binding protein [Blastococcus sp. Marseille-P5729]|uniref:CueP family metal-binding protein n=1 Tax=Blastococcus sp. Marseille-P5729 TaxID=2086582 RepID=UPI0018FF0E59|nr:CueP family metal-binding protein [Blastococcus sp. Marseille-P5729]